MKLLVVILNYKVTDLAIDCLRSLEGRIGQVKDARVAILENGSGGDAVERLRRAIEENGWSSWCDLMVTSPNRGFTGGNNFVIRPALESGDPPEYVVLLNSDTIVQDGAMDRLVAFMDATPRAGIAGSALTYPGGELQASPFRFLGVVAEFDGALRFGPVSRLLERWWVVPPRPAAACSVEWVSGASMILRTSMLRQIGLLDEGLYTYFDDVDICLRARRAGWETWWVPESQVVHLEGASTGLATSAAKRKPAYWFQARRRFFLKNYGAAYAAAVDAAFLVGYSLWRVRRRLQGKPDQDPPHLLTDFFRHSVFRAGFQVAEVENPAMPRTPGA